MSLAWDAPLPVGPPPPLCPYRDALGRPCVLGPTHGSAHYIDRALVFLSPPGRAS